jgi:hypothetical protein
MNSDQENIALVLIKFKVAWLGRTPRSHYFFISVEGKDPSASFLKQLGKNFVGESLAIEDKNARNPIVSNVIHKQTRKPGIIIYVRDIKIIKPNQAVATCRHHSGLLNAEWSDCHLRKVNTKWAIVRRENIRKA